MTVSTVHPDDDEPLSQISLRRMGANYSDKRHSGYVSRLVAAITRDPPARNVALAGGYGIGKSSILGGLKQWLEALHIGVLEISLTTVARPAADEGKTTQHAAPEQSLSTELQREIVKRVLYSAKPSSLPGSRFTRIRGPRVVSSIVLAASISILATGIAYSFGAQLPFRRLFEGWLASDWRWTGWIADALLVFVLALAVRLVLNGLTVKDVGVGPARLTLARHAGNYFDQYLDELIYFFAKTRTQVVIFEDLDRFSNTEIYVELRDLNTLLNQSPQVADPVTFIYAARDSLFDVNRESGGTLIGVDSAASDRAKFFDVIVPVVPFISHAVASDLLRRELKKIPKKLRPPRRLIQIAGRHLTDMRVLISVRNEYLIFLEELYEKATIIGLTPGALISMVLFKHAEPLEFEKIRTGDSKLDVFVDAMSAALQSRVAWYDQQIGSLSSAIELGANSARTANRLGERLTAAAELHFRIINSGSSAGLNQVTVDSNAFDRRSLGLPAFWESIASAPDNMRVQLSFADGTGIRVRVSDLLEMVDVTDVSALIHPNRDPDGAELEQLKKDRKTLLESSISSQISDASLSGPGAEGLDVSFFGMATELLGATITFDLVRIGAIDKNFGLYTTTYYGAYVSAVARSFMLLNVDRRRSAPLVRLSPRDVDAILTQYGDSLFSNPASLNVSIVDNTVAKPQISLVLDLITSGGSDTVEEFVETYMTVGQHPSALISALASRWPRLLDLIAQTSRITGSQRLTFLNDALANLSPHIEYQMQPETKLLIESEQNLLGVFHSEINGGKAVALALLLSSNGITVSDLSSIPRPTRDELARRTAFVISRKNLAAISDGPAIGIDTLSDRIPAVADYVVAHAELYIEALDSGAPPASSLDDPARITAVANRIADANPDFLEPMLSRAYEGGSIADITDLVDRSAWPSVVATQTLEPTVANVQAYVTELGGIDAKLARYFRRFRALTEPDHVPTDQRLTLAGQIIAERSVGETRKLSLIQSLMLETPLAPAAATAGGASLSAKLIRAGLVSDNAATFDALSELPWEEREMLIAASKNLPAFIGEMHLEPQELNRILRSEALDPGVRRALFENLDELLSRVDMEGAELILAYAREQYLQLADSQLIAASERGAAPNVLLGYLGIAGDFISDEQLVRLLRSLGKPYASLVALDQSKSRFVGAPGLMKLLTRLNKMGLVTTPRQLRNDDLQVTAKGG